MNRRFLSVFFIIFLLTSCRSILPVDYQSKNDKITLRLQTIADLENMMRKITYEGKHLDGDILPVRLKSRYIYPDFISNESYSSDQRINDLLKLFVTEMEFSVYGNDSAYQGMALMEIMYFAESRDPFFSIISPITAFIPNLLGMPFGNVMTDIEVSITIKDFNNNKLKTYIGKGYANTYIGLYWSYGGDAKRKSAMVAFKEAMQEIKIKAITDTDWLKGQLKK